MIKMSPEFCISWRQSRYGTTKAGINVASCTSWVEANKFLPCLETGLNQYFATIDDGVNMYHFLVTKGAGPLEVIAMQDYPNLSIDDVLFKQ